MENRNIKVQYKLYAPMGEEKKIEMIEETRPDMPFHFISGMGMVLEALENKLYPLQEGETFKITCSKFSIQTAEGKVREACMKFSEICEY